MDNSDGHQTYYLHPGSGFPSNDGKDSTAPLFSQDSGAGRCLPGNNSPGGHSLTNQKGNGNLVTHGNNPAIEVCSPERTSKSLGIPFLFLTAHKNDRRMM